MLEVADLEVYYENIRALQGISIKIYSGEIVSLIGANGAGKSTLLKAICGLLPIHKGSIKFLDTDITNLPTHQVIKLGIAHVPEGRRLFAELSVMENLELGAYSYGGRRKFMNNLKQIWDIFPVLLERKNQLAGTLSGGEQQMLSIGRALMSAPKLLLLDEPSLGLAPFLVREIFKLIQQIRAQGTTILLVEQNARLALGIADRGYVLETGRIVLTDTAENLSKNELVKRAYLGE